jgi:hypothetical protein
MQTKASITINFAGPLGNNAQNQHAADTKILLKHQNRIISEGT